MKKYGKVVIESKGKKSYKWALQAFGLSICLSLLFGLFSQTLLTRLGIIIAICGIGIFIFISVIFDMIGIAAAGANEEQFIEWQKEGVIGADVGLKLCHNSEKVCSFCADVVGDICSTICGAGGACVVVSIASRLSNSTAVLILSVSVSALIAGLTIFFKALMKNHALTKANLIILKIGALFEKTLFRKNKKEKNVKK